MGEHQQEYGRIEAPAHLEERQGVVGRGLGAGGGGEIPWKKVSLSLLGDNVGAKSLPYGFATWEFGFAVTHLTVRVEREELILESLTIFKDNSGRSNYRTVEKFKKK